jgi:hypothetical protein
MGDANRSIVRVTAHAGEVLSLDASASTDPDGDELDFRWTLYPEAGDAQVRILDETAPRTTVEVPADRSGNSAHVILRVTDRNEQVPMTAYRRIVIDIE